MVFRRERPHMNNEYLFPQRLTRRDFLGAAAAGAAAAAAATWPGAARADEAPVVLGSGRHRYTLDPAWGQLPQGMRYGFGCALVVDSQDRIYVTSRSASPCVAIFGRDGAL